MALNLRILVLALVVFCLVSSSFAWWSRGSSSRSGSSSSRSSSSRRSSSRSSKPAHDIKTKQGLTDLYNQPVDKVERMKRPLSGFPGKVSHSGVVVTTKSGERVLIHKGNGYGSTGGNTVAVNAKHMNQNNWEKTDERQVNGNKNIGDFVKAGGKDYGLLGDNCHHASGRMMKEADKKQDG